MKRIFRSSSFYAVWVLAGILAAAASPAFAQGIYPPFLLGLQTDRAEYWKGEPVQVRVRIRNWLSPITQVETFFGYQGAATEFYIVHGGEWKEPYRSFHRVEPVSDQVYMMQYGKAHEFTLPVLYDPAGADHLALNATGEYRFRLVQALYYLNLLSPMEGKKRWVVEAFSPVVKVTDPPPEFAGAFEMLRSRPSTFLDLNRQLASPANKRILEDVVREYPRSRYAPYCLHALGALEALFIKTHYEFREKAIRLYERLVDEYPDYPLRDEARIFLAELLQKNAELDKAVAIVYRLLEESPDNLYRFRKSPLMKPLRKERENPYRLLPMHCWEFFDTTELTDAGFQMAVEPEFPESGETY